MTVEPLKLAGIDGANPLGFLAAVGALVSLQHAGEGQVRLRWARDRVWTPVLEGLSTSDPAELSEALVIALRGRPVSDQDEQNRKSTESVFKAAKKAVEDKKKEIRERGLPPAERTVAFETEVAPLETCREEVRGNWLNALKAAVPRPELALGLRIDCTRSEYREHARAFLHDAQGDDRETVDLLASFGSDACLEDKSDAIAATPLCFIRGSGQQFFLDTVRKLIAAVTAESVRQALFDPWEYRDEKLSMRWDPSEERQYALMERDPGPIGSKTVWMANLLAYRAMTLLPCAPVRSGLAATGWSIDDEVPVLTWPIWEFSATPDMVRSMLQLPDLADPTPPVSSLRARGIATTFRSRRIKVGAGANFKLNFSPARCL